jgi:hypothetical protein
MMDDNNVYTQQELISKIADWAKKIGHALEESPPSYHEINGIENEMLKVVMLDERYNILSKSNTKQSRTVFR